MKYYIYYFLIILSCGLLIIALNIEEVVHTGYIELPEEIHLATKGDTLTTEVINHIQVIEFYHGNTNQKNKQLLIVK